MPPSRQTPWVALLGYGMGWFSAFREEGWPTWYGEQHTPVTADLVFVAILYTFSVLTAAVLVVIIGIRGKGRWATFFWALFCLQLGAILLLAITGHEWQTAYVDTTSDYSILTNQQIKGRIGVKVGLKSVNITLKGEVKTAHGMARVDYNERFFWDAVDEMRDGYEKARVRGLPLPILNVAEYFSADSGGLRWTRSFRQAGHFVYICLWASFAAYLVSNILICLVVARGAMLFTVTGLLMLFAVILYHVMQPSHPLLIHLDDGNFLRLSYGVSLYLVLGSGILSVLVGAIIWLCNQKWPLKMATFFLIDTSFLEEEMEAELNGLHDSDEALKGKRYTSNRGVDNDGFIMDDMKKSTANGSHLAQTPSPRPVKMNGSHGNAYQECAIQVEKEISDATESDLNINDQQQDIKYSKNAAVRDKDVKVSVVAL